jgi:hypothetical protein
LAEGRLQDLRNSIVSFVHARYPALEELADKQIATSENTERLEQLRMDLYMARSAKRVKQHLLALHKNSSGQA